MRFVMVLMAVTCLVGYGARPAMADDAQQQPTGKEEQPKKGEKKAVAKSYGCPMCPGVSSDKPGKCPHCGMELKEGSGKH